MRFPHIGGDLVTFVAEDDVWLAPVDGGRAWRVSADRSPAASPRFSPDGAQLAWTSRRTGRPEVYAATADGGPADRLTYWGHRTTDVRGWTPTGDVLAVTSAGEPFSRDHTWAHAVPLDGGPATRLPYGPVSNVAWGPDGAILLTTPVREPSWWKRYRGGTAGKLWLGRDEEWRRLFEESTAQLWCGMWAGDRIVFLADWEYGGAPESARTGQGVGNLYSCRPDGSDLRRHTDHREFYARQASTDGTRVVYGCAGDLWILDDLDAEPRRLDIRLGGPRTARRPYPVEGKVGSYAVDATGRASVIESRGTVHWLTHRDGPAIALAARPGVRARIPRPLGAEQAIWVTDAEGDDALEIGPAGTRRLAAGTLGRVLELAVSPDGTTAAVASHDGALILIDLATDERRTLDRATNGEVCDLAFSPDSTHLAWSHPGPGDESGQLRQIKAARLADDTVIEVTPLRFVDTDPVFTKDGEHLAFLSLRTFDPVYDAHVFDLSFPGGCRPYLVPLKAATPAPFAPSLRGRPAKVEEDDEATGTTTTEIEAEGIQERITPLPVRAGRYSRLRAAKGGLLWLRLPLRGALGDSAAGPDDDPDRPVLERYGFARRKLETIAEKATSFEVSGDGAWLVLRDGKTMRVTSAERKEDKDGEDAFDVDLSRIRVTVDPAAEWRQMYAEAGRLMRDHFWRADMGGVDWDAIQARYAPLVDRAGGHDDLVDLLWEVQGELGTSHAYVSAKPGEEPEHQGFLGADLARDDGDAWRVARLLPGESSDPSARCPLAAPGVAVRPGDAIVAVDGRPVDPVRGPAPLLAGKADKPVELTVAGEAAESHEAAERRVAVVPIGDEEPLRYHGWVAGRRAHVHEISGGRVGYLHVPDMVASGWAQLHRDLHLETDREALVLDVRDNSGGHISELVIEKIARTVVGWNMARGYQPMRYPSDAPRGPIVAVTDQNAGSDGDIVTAAFQAKGIGPVVGTRTWGGVIGIDMRYTLVDGTLVTQPRYSFWLRGPGWGVENHGVEPDVEVPMNPADHVAGRDPQLDTAVRLALDALAETPAVTPPEIP